MNQSKRLEILGKMVEGVLGDTCLGNLHYWLHEGGLLMTVIPFTGMSNKRWQVRLITNTTDESELTLAAYGETSWTLWEAIESAAKNLLVTIRNTEELKGSCGGEGAYLVRAEERDWCGAIGLDIQDGTSHHLWPYGFSVEMLLADAGKDFSRCEHSHCVWNCASREMGVQGGAEA